MAALSRDRVEIQGYRKGDPRASWASTYSYHCLCFCYEHCWGIWTWRSTFELSLSFPGAHECNSNGSHCLHQRSGQSSWNWSHTFELILLFPSVWMCDAKVIPSSKEQYHSKKDWGMSLMQDGRHAGIVLTGQVKHQTVFNLLPLHLDWGKQGLQAFFQKQSLSLFQFPGKTHRFLNQLMESVFLVLDPRAEIHNMGLKPFVPQRRCSKL